MKQSIKSAHLTRGDAETRQVTVGHADSVDQSVQGSLGILPNLIWGSPEDDDRIAVTAVKELVRPSDHPEHTGVGYDPQRGPIPYVGVVPLCRGVVHANHTLCTIDLVSCAAPQDMAGARHQRTAMTV